MESPTTTTTTMASVWVQLYYKGEDEPVGSPIFIKTASLDPPNIGALIKATKTELSPDLDHASISRISAYLPETTPPFSEDKAMRPGMKLEQIVEELKTTTPPTSDNHPLIVVAPAPPQNPANGKKNARFGSFVSFCSIFLMKFRLCVRDRPH